MNGNGRYLGDAFIMKVCLSHLIAAFVSLHPIGVASQARCLRCEKIDRMIAINDLDGVAIPMSQPFSRDLHIAQMEANAITRAAIKFIPNDDSPITMECYFGAYKKNPSIMGAALDKQSDADQRLLRKVITDYGKAEKSKGR